MQENAPLEEVFEHLKCTREGLTSDAVQQRLELFGYNKLEEKKVKINVDVWITLFCSVPNSTSSLFL